MAFITCNKKVKIRDMDGGEVIEFPIFKGYIGAVPKWVEEHHYFKKLCKDGTITQLIDDSSSKAEQQQKLSAEKEKKAAHEAEKKAAMDKAKAEAKALANQQAADNGLDKIAHKNLTKQLMEEAIKQVEDEFSTK